MTNRPTRIGPVSLTLVFLVFSTAAYMLLSHWSQAGSDRVIVMPSQTIDLQVSREQPERQIPQAPPLEQAPVPPVNAPGLPDDEADKAELWTYGETYLGWEPLADVDLKEYSAAEMRAWLQTDLSLYDWGDGVDYEESE